MTRAFRPGDRVADEDGILRGWVREPSRDQVASVKASFAAAIIEAEGRVYVAWDGLIGAWCRPDKLRLAADQEDPVTDPQPEPDETTGGQPQQRRPETGWAHAGAPPEQPPAPPEP